VSENYGSCPRLRYSSVNVREREREGGREGGRELKNDPCSSRQLS